MQPLEKLVKQVDKNTGVKNPAAEKLIIIDSGGDTHAQRPIFPIFFSYYYYVVYFTQTLSYKGRLCTFQHEGNITHLLVEYDIQCRWKDAEILVRNIHDNPYAKNLPNALLRQEAEQYHYANTLTRDFYDKQQVLLRKLHKSLNAIGLTATRLQLKLEGEHGAIPSDTIAIHIGSFKVSLAGCVPKASMGMQATIAPRKGQEALALRYQQKNEEYENAFLRIIKQHMLGYVTPEDLLANYNTTIRQTITDRLADYLHPRGMQLREFNLSLFCHGKPDTIILTSQDAIQPPILNSHQPVTLKYHCELVASSTLGARVLLFPPDTAEMETMIRDQINNAFTNDIPAEMFEKHLNTVFAEQVSGALDKKLVSWGRKTGKLQFTNVALQQDSPTLPLLPGSKETEGFRPFEIIYREYNLFSKVEGVLLALAVSIEGRLQASGDDVNAGIEKIMDGHLRHFFQEIYPERFYMRFHQPDASLGDQQSLENEIKEQLITLLAQSYNAEIDAIAVKPLDTPMTIRLKQLRKDIFTFSFRDQSGQYCFKSGIRILSVAPHHWATFNAKGYLPRSEDAQDTERREIAAHLTAFMEDALNNALIPQLKTGMIQADTDLPQIMNDKHYKRAIIEIREIFGLSIILEPPIAIRMVQLDDKNLQHRLQLKEKASQLDMLYRHRQQMDKNGVAPQSASRKDIEDRIKELEDEISKIIGVSVQRAAMGQLPAAPVDNLQNSTGATNSILDISTNVADDDDISNPSK